MSILRTNRRLLIDEVSLQRLVYWHKSRDARASAKLNSWNSTFVR
jgi:hypothetical protein